MATTLNAAAALPLFGTDVPGDRRPPIDDDVHAAASAAARWHQKVNRMFGSGTGGTGRLGRASALFGTAVPGISQLVLEDAAGAGGRCRNTMPLHLIQPGAHHHGDKLWDLLYDAADQYQYCISAA